MYVCWTPRSRRVSSRLPLEPPVGRVRTGLRSSFCLLSISLTLKCPSINRYVPKLESRGLCLRSWKRSRIFTWPKVSKNGSQPLLTLKPRIEHSHRHKQLTKTHVSDPNVWPIRGRPLTPPVKGTGPLKSPLVFREVQGRTDWLSMVKWSSRSTGVEIRN